MVTYTGRNLIGHRLSRKSGLDDCVFIRGHAFLPIGKARIQAEALFDDRRLPCPSVRAEAYFGYAFSYEIRQFL